MTEKVKITVTEALAELKTIDKRVEKKKGFVISHLLRLESMKDPLEKDGGQAKAVAAEIQSATDLLERKVAIRQAVHAANAQTEIGIDGITKTVEGWQLWRKEVAPELQRLFGTLSQQINSTRQEAQKRGTPVSTVGQEKPGDVIVNVNEMALRQEIERIEQVLGKLDGLLSLKNATTFVEV